MDRTAAAEAGSAAPQQRAPALRLCAEYASFCPIRDQRGGDKGKKGRHQYGADEGRQDLADAAEDNSSHHLHSSEDQA